MDLMQEKLFTDWRKKRVKRLDYSESCLAIQTWQACLDANRIPEKTKPSLKEILFEISKTVTAIDKKLEPENGNVEENGKWKPKEGDLVFLLSIGGKVFVGQITDIGLSRGMVRVKYGNGELGSWDCDRVKPFNFESVGKPWSEI